MISLVPPANIAKVIFNELQSFKSFVAWWSIVLVFIGDNSCQDPLLLSSKTTLSNSMGSFLGICSEYPDIVIQFKYIQNKQTNKNKTLPSLGWNNPQSY